jgi:hypothetical protein
MDRNAAGLTFFIGPSDLLKIIPLLSTKSMLTAYVYPPIFESVIYHNSVVGVRNYREKNTKQKFEGGASDKFKYLSRPLFGLDLHCTTLSMHVYKNPALLVTIQ